MEFCSQLFALEEEYKKQGLSFDQRFQVRLERSKPVAEAFFTWAKAEYEKNPVPKIMLGAALTYAVRQEGWLMNVFLDGRLELSNNRAERSVWPFALGRKNWMFSNTPRGANASAAIYSLVETAKANGLEAVLKPAECRMGADFLPNGHVISVRRQSRQRLSNRQTRRLDAGILTDFKSNQRSPGGKRYPKTAF